MNTIVAMEILRLFVTVITGSFAIHALSNVKVELCEDLLFVNHKMAFYFLEHNSGTRKINNLPSIFNIFDIFEAARSSQYFKCESC